MAGVARGINTKIQAWQETAYATTPGTPVSESLYFLQFTPNPSLEQLIDQTISGGYRGQLKPIIGKKNVGGQIQTNLAPESCAKLLANTIGAPTITNLGVGQNQFVFAPNGSGAHALPVGMGAEIDYGSNMPTPGRFLVLKGLRVSKLALSFKASGFVTANYDVVGSDYDWSGSATVATPTDYGHTAWSMFEAALQEGGSAYASMEQVDITFDNDLDDTLYTINAGGVRGQLPEGALKINGTCIALFDSMALLTKALANTSSSLNITLTRGTGVGTAGNEECVFDVPGLTYKLDGVPVNGPKGLMAKLQFTSFRAGGAEDGTTVTLKAARAAA